MTKPQLATILEDGTYGNREMTDEEHAEYLETIKPQTPSEEPATVEETVDEIAVDPLEGEQP
jgi:hypothetical protein